ncbi:BTAD domain-containing putative transcriptional regulator [Amycolatopsis endophytica]|uniref:DNA-binding SARP family transcriptional activator n=1 Tax=Amycolatopsis endophytica TaxID=860233 RepID=A0A853B477_9PSEU|nr:DNA-binding SARP family transcriptional activator [Amycolatopsis endophytica]
MFFRVLGPLDVEEVRGRSVPLGGPKPRLLLAALLLQPGVVVSADALTDVLWPGRVPRSAAANLRTYVHGLRRLLGGRIEGRAGGYLLRVAPEELDATLAEQLVTRAHEENLPALLDEAAALWRGEVLEDLPHHHSWSSAVARFGELRLSVQEERLRIRVEAGRHADAIVELRGLLAGHPLREELWRLLVVALGASGRESEALAAYGEAERVLRSELDAVPGPRLRQALAEVAPAAPVCQLPLDLPDFTGREEQLAGLTAALDGERTAVVVLSGSAGAGKSALAVHAAHAARGRYPDGQLYVDLRGTSESPRRPLDVLPELLHALGVPDAGIPRGLDERSALLRSRLAGRRVCLVLDDAGDAASVRPLLPGAGACAVLITSRGRLPDLTGAAHLDVGVLPEAEAAELLSRIAGGERTAAEPEAAAAIVAACGRLPLAIRVAGSRLSHRREWTLRALAARLADERRRLDELRVGDLAVRASLALSYDQLPGSCARAFRTLGTLGPLPFPGWVVAALLDRAGDDALDVLVDAHLVDLVDDQPRYRLHDLVRCYAAELAEPEPVETRRERVRRVVEGYLALATEAADRMPVRFFGAAPPPLPPDLWRPDGTVPDDPVAWFGNERPVALVELAVEWGLDALAWQLAAAFTPYFDLGGHHDDWRRTHELALGAAERAGDLRGQAIVLRNLGQLDVYQDDYPGAHAGFERALSLFRRIGDDQGAAVALAGLSTIRRVSGDHEAALSHCHDALELFTRSGDRHGEAVVRIAIGSVWLARGCHATAERWFTDAREACVEIGDRHREAHARHRMALLHQHRGNLGRAREELDRAIVIFGELGDDHCVGYAHQSLGQLCLRSGDLAHAKLLLVNSLSVHRRDGDRRSEAEAGELLGELHERLGQVREARGHFQRSLEIWQDLGAGEAAAALRERLRHHPLTMIAGGSILVPSVTSKEAGRGR